MTAATDLDKVVADLFIWQAYDQAVKVDLFSTAIVTANGIFVVDPIPLRKAPLAQLHEQGAIAGVIVDMAFGILFGGIVLALALAVGLGSRDLVSRSIEKEVSRPQEPAGEEKLHHF